MNKKTGQEQFEGDLEDTSRLQNILWAPLPRFKDDTKKKDINIPFFCLEEGAYSKNPPTSGKHMHHSFLNHQPDTGVSNQGEIDQEDSKSSLDSDTESQLE